MKINIFDKIKVFTNVKVSYDDLRSYTSPNTFKNVGFPLSFNKKIKNVEVVYFYYPKEKSRYLTVRSPFQLKKHQSESIVLSILLLSLLIINIILYKHENLWSLVGHTDIQEVPVE